MFFCHRFFAIVTHCRLLLLIREWIISAHTIHTTTRNERWIFLRLLFLHRASVVWTSHLEIKRHTHYSLSSVSDGGMRRIKTEREREMEKNEHSYKVVPACRRCASSTFNIYYWHFSSLYMYAYIHVNCVCVLIWFCWLGVCVLIFL